MKSHFVWLGKTRMRYRLKSVMFGLKVIWRAINGWDLSTGIKDD